VKIVTIPVGMLATNCYLVVDQTAGKAALIDPAADPAKLLDALAKENADLATILLTHGHADHVGALTAVAHATGAPVRLHSADVDTLHDAGASTGFMLPADWEPPELVETLEDGDQIEVGGITVSVLHTPGHTPGSCSFLAEGHLFSGDLLFAGSVGRTDMPGGDTRRMIRTLIEKIMPLPAATKVHPGHGPSTTIGAEKASNPFLERDRLEWRG
jgi:hydroxyacylglutathione hydrolase